MKESKEIFNAINELDELEKEKTTIPQIFAEIFKDEINAVPEEDLYYGVRNVLEKYSKDTVALSVINEYTKSISGGASLNELFHITIEELSDTNI